MDKVRVFYDRQGTTLTVWFGNPQDEYICEETVIGFEKLNYSVPTDKHLHFSFETVSK